LVQNGSASDTDLILPQAEALIRGIVADLRIGGDKAYYHVAGDFIRMPPPQAFYEAINCRQPHNLFGGNVAPCRATICAGRRRTQHASEWTATTILHLKPSLGLRCPELRARRTVISSRPQHQPVWVLGHEQRHHLRRQHCGPARSVGAAPRWGCACIDADDPRQGPS
jgi:hypothetical protein